MLHPRSPVVRSERDRSIDIGGFVLTETVRRAEYSLPWHFHEHTNVSFVLSGSFVETIGKRAVECRPSTLIVRPAGEAHLNQYRGAETRSLIVQVKPCRLEMIRQATDVLNSEYQIRDGGLSVLALRIYKEFRFMDGTSCLAIEALILEILTQLSRQNRASLTSAKPRWLCETQDLIHENFSTPISLSSIAETVGVHPAHLARTFRRHYRCTVGDYIRRLRLDNAVRELMTAEKSLAEIGLAAGFYDQSHFSRSFKLHLGMTPAEFRAATKTRKSDTEKLLRSKT